jgi:hypothetical protein
MPANLIDAFPTPDRGKREFCLPLASETPIPRDGAATPIDWDRINSLAPAGLFTIEDDRSHTNPVLTLRVSPPASGSFAQDGNLPHPAIRLHAIGRGILTFKRGDNSSAHSLTLEMAGLFGKIFKENLGTVVGLNLAKATWFDRWIEAGCIPKLVVYENVDLAPLQLLIRTLVEASPPREPPWPKRTD